MPVNRNASVDAAIDVGKALEFRWRGMSFADIGRVFGVSTQSVIMRLKRWQGIVHDPSLPNIFDTQAVGILKSVHLQAVLAMQRKLEDRKSTVNNLAFASTQLFNQIRLLEGKSTNNIATLTRVIMQAHKAEAEQAKIESIPDQGIEPDTQAIDISSEPSD